MKEEALDPTDQEVIDKMLETRLDSNDPRWTEILDDIIKLHSTGIVGDQYSVLAARMLNRMQEYQEIRDREEDEYWEKVKSTMPRFPFWTSRLIKEYKSSGAIAVTELITGIDAPPSFQNERFKIAKKELLRLANRYIK